MAQHAQPRGDTKALLNVQVILAASPTLGPRGTERHIVALLTLRSL